VFNKKIPADLKVKFDRKKTVLNSYFKWPTFCQTFYLIIKQNSRPCLHSWVGILFFVENLFDQIVLYGR
jgi:hypothetical protein